MGNRKESDSNPPLATNSPFPEQELALSARKNEDDLENEESNEKPPKQKINFEHTLPRAEAVAYFEAIVQGLKNGNVQFKQEDRLLTLQVPDHVDVKVKASRKGDKSKIEFSLTFSGADTAGLSISSK